MSFLMTTRRAMLWLAVPTAMGISLAAMPQIRMSGFTPESSASEQSFEAQMRALASPGQIRQFHRYLTAEPHPAGSKRNNDLAQWVAEQWKEQGLEDVTIHRYDVLNSTPRSVSVDLVSPVEFRA